ncbi:staygreen family protein [Fictibacillus iocasae]|uniref:Staygreen family protein n=1 Tax=Fictibacillus iocasae TaxID=2715437 RepID=A0ABW2NQ47_9BACL
MVMFNPKKLKTVFMPPATETEPVIGRRYTLTHSDETGDLFLDIGTEYAWNQITAMRDEVLGEWKTNFAYPVFAGQVLVADSTISKETAKVRFDIFTRELPLALRAIRYGDKNFFQAHSQLDMAPIWMFFESYYPEYNGFRDFGIFKTYA